MDNVLSDNQFAALWLSVQDGISASKKRRLLDLAGEPCDFESEFSNLKPQIIKLIGEAATKKLEATKQLRDSQAAELKKRGFTYIDYTHPAFPDNLNEIDNAPIGLFVAGDVSVLKNRMIAVIGTRKPTRYAVKVTETFTREFVRAGLTIVSGLARGIDGAAHVVTVKEGGIAVAVLGSGLDVIYPSEHKGLYEKIIASGGAVISEYPFGERPMQFHFPERNRIISALSEGVFLPEAGKKSGSLNTIGHAAEQGKDVFVVPSTIFNPASEGSNELLRTYPDALVLEPDDVLKTFKLSSKPQEKSIIQLSLIETQIMSMLDGGEELHFEEILAETDLNAGELGSVLFELEMKGVIDKLSGNYYAKS